MKKNILVTGASGNVGQAIVEKLLQEGQQVIATFSPGKIKSQTGVAAYEADLVNELSVNDAFKKILADYSTVDAAVLTVGGFALGNLEQTNLDAIHKMMAVNFDTTFNIIKPLFQQMQAQGGGRIVVIGARPGIKISEGTGSVAYALSKAMVIKLAELLNAEGKDKNIVCSVIIPGVIDTPSNRAAQSTANFSDWVKPEAIAEAISFLFSNNADALREPILKMYSNS